MKSVREGEVSPLVMVALLPLTAIAGLVTERIVTSKMRSLLAGMPVRVCEPYASAAGMMSNRVSPTFAPTRP